MSASKKLSLAIHGGCGLIERTKLEHTEKEAICRSALQDSLVKGFQKLKESCTALEAVVLAVRIMEDCPVFNAGKGSVFNSEGFVEMDAGVMDSAGKVGAVSSVTRVKNPVVLAAEVYQNSVHPFLCASGAELFGEQRKVEMVTPDYFHTKFRKNQLDEVLKTPGHPGAVTPRQDHDVLGAGMAMDTVGAVALDQAGILAAASSTGGLTGKWPGRVSDSSIVGAGFYADQRVALSGTGNGDYFIRRSLCKHVADLMQMTGLSLEQAANQSVFQLMPDCNAGLIGLDSGGNIAMPYNTSGMFRGFINYANEEKPYVAIWDV